MLFSTLYLIPRFLWKFRNAENSGLYINKSEVKVRILQFSIILSNFHVFKDRKIMMKFLVGSCEQRPMLRDGTVLRSSAVTIGTNPVSCTGLHDRPIEELYTRNGQTVFTIFCFQRMFKIRIGITMFYVAYIEHYW